MKKHVARQVDPSILSILQRTGTGWRGLVASVAGARPALVDTAEFPADAGGRLAAWIDGHAAAEVLCILPASAVICRTCTLPVAGPEQLAQALQLQAEAHLASAPLHRTATAVLDAAPGEPTRTGLILAWPPAAAFEPPALPGRIRYTPDVAALAALVDGLRPDEPLIWVDRADGSLALALAHTNGEMFRATREDLGGESGWEQSVARVVAETALSVGHTGAFVEAEAGSAAADVASLEPLGARLVVPAQIIEQAAAAVSGAPTDRRWWSKNGLLVGALLARTGSLRALTVLEDQAPTESPSPVKRLAASMSRPAMATRLAAAAVILLILGPLALSWMRLQVLRVRYPQDELSRQVKLIQDTKKIRAMYRELEKERWTMTKLLADVVCCAPEGIALEDVRIDFGDSVAVSGAVLPDADLKLTAPQVVEKMQAQLLATGIFTNVRLKWEKPTSYGKYAFDLSAEVVRPHREFHFPLEQDFGQYTLTDRAWGVEPGQAEVLASGQPPLALAGGADEPDAAARPGAGEREPAAPDRIAGAIPGDGAEGGIQAPEDESRARSGRPRLGGPGLGGGTLGGGDAKGRIQGDRPSEGGVAQANEVPPPLTQAQVDLMDDATSMDALMKISKARKFAKATKDDELDQRLRKDFDMIIARRKQLVKESAAAREGKEEARPQGGSGQ